ncbi:MAG: N-acetylmuramoyl-L-alanine amidase [Planctomycetes bacterium]|nr:N-acetylmuramoyl-L-alanine amidase [Planctomycetota bacterium]
MTAALWTTAAWLFMAADPPDIDLETLAQRYGLTRVTDSATGREILRDRSVTLVLAPGLATVLWNGQARPLPRPVRIAAGRVVVPPEVEELLSGRTPRALPTPTPAIAKTAPRSVGRTPRPFRIVVDAGHGGRHTGGKGRHGLLEKDVVLDVALRLRELLQSYGVDVVMTRTTDAHFDFEVDDDLARRVDIANRARPDFFLSIHANWVIGPQARGFEVYVPRHMERSRSGSLWMAREIESQFKDHLDTENRGVKEAGFRVLRGTRAPAVLVELEFISNLQGERELGDPAHRRKLAGLLFEAVKRYISRS